MRRSKSTQELMRESQAVLDGDANPDTSEQRSVVKVGDTLYVNVTDYAQKKYGVQEGDPIVVHTVTGGICIEPKSNDDGDD